MAAGSRSGGRARRPRTAAEGSPPRRAESAKTFLQPPCCSCAASASCPAPCLDLAAIEPRTYATLLPAGARDAVLGLGPGEALLRRTSARLRPLGRAGRIRLAEGRSLRVAGVIDDRLVRRAEIVVSAREGARWARGAPPGPALLGGVGDERAVWL